MEEAGNEVPSYFVCPISRRLMEDPVTVSSGITYDRESIEQWMVSCEKAFCPVTRESLFGRDTTPNHILRRLIQCWCSSQSACCDTRSAPQGKPKILELLNEDKSSEEKDGFFCSLIEVLGNGNSQSRAHAVGLLKSAIVESDPDTVTRSKPELFNQVVRILRDKISVKASKAALDLLVDLCASKGNRTKAVENGAASALIELLLENDSIRVCELSLAALDRLCCCAEGRAELLRHGAGLAVVSKKILRVSSFASERAVTILRSISKHSANVRIINEMVQVGVASKLCLVVQMEKRKKTRERAEEILRMNSRVWRESTCIAPQLLQFYPSC